MAKTPYLDATKLATILADGGYSRHILMTEASNLLLLSGLHVLRMRWLWESAIEEITDPLWELIIEFLEEAEGQLMSNFAIGTVFSSVALLTDPSVILMIGQLVPVVDYPILATVVPPAWIVGSDIQIPDMRDTSVHGASVLLDLGTVMGENDVTLSVAEIPSHAHTQNPHTHSYINQIGTPTGAGPIVAGASIVVPTPSVTGIATPTINNTGGDGSHNNVPQSLEVAWYLIGR